MQFTALKDFWCEETQSQYCKGLSYTVRPFESYGFVAKSEKESGQIKARCEALAKLAPSWIKEGRVRPGGPDGGTVRGG